MQHPLFVTGMMGCGKTTVGRILAHERGVELVDLDQRIERLFGATIPELFAEGESRFREREALALRTLLDEPGLGAREVVVATGGGAVLDPRSRAAMDEVGVRVFLEVGVDELVRRLRPGVAGGGRPLLSDPVALRRRVAELLAARHSCYRAGARCVDGHGEPAAVAARVSAALGESAAAQDSEAV